MGDNFVGRNTQLILISPFILLELTRQHTNAFFLKEWIEAYFSILESGNVEESAQFIERLEATIEPLLKCWEFYKIDIKFLEAGKGKCNVVCFKAHNPFHVQGSKHLLH